MKKPDWSEWSLMPKVEVWQAVALSMDLEAHDLHMDVHTPLLGFGSFFKPNSFPSSAKEREFEKRLRILEANLEDSAKFPNVVINRELRLSIVALPEFSAWAVSVGWEIPEELAKKSAEADEVDRVTSNCKDMEIKHAALFDYVSPEQLEKMFPSGGHWKDWTRRAKAQGLDVARREKKYNPYLAARWWINKHPQDGWDWVKV
ncbi:MAG: hypothetical protein EBU49_12955, partial [Proteobacteria bacterium]|nr:hypothetical protein [Pseudomonadota bacterium]